MLSLLLSSSAYSDLSFLNVNEYIRRATSGKSLFHRVNQPQTSFYCREPGEPVCLTRTDSVERV